MRDLLSKLDAIANETALNPNDPKSDYDAKKQALDDLERDGKTDAAAIQQRRLDLDKEAESKGVKEHTVFEIGDEFGISFSEDHEIATTIVDILQDGIVIELDDAAMNMLTNEGVRFFEGELVEDLDEARGTCWVGYEQKGMKKKGAKMVPNCVKEDHAVTESGLQYHTGVKKHGKEYMVKAAAAGRDGASQKELGALKDKYSKAYKEDHRPEDPQEDPGEYDREGAMAKDQLRVINDAAKELYSLLHAEENLPEWVQKKIILAMDYIDTARDYMKSTKYDEAEEKTSAGGTIKRTDTGLKHYAKYDDDQDDYDDDKLDKARIRRIEKATKPDDLDEAEYQGRKVQLGKKMAGDVKKSKVYVKNPQGNVVKVNFGDKKMRIKKSNPARRKSFRARHNCANPGPRHKARYWSCRSW